MAKHPFHSVYKRAFYSFIGLFFIMFVGTVGVHFIENMSYMDAFYFMSMITTGQGPYYTPHTDVGKIFVATMAFLSVGIGVAALGFLFGPFMGQLFHIGRMKMEDEANSKKFTVEES